MTQATSRILTLPHLQATHLLGEHLGRSLPAGTVLLLRGDLGSGKTSLVQGIGQGLGIVDPIVSPTFTLINEYLEGRVPLYHLDLYRLDAGAIAPLNIDAYWDASEYPPGIVAIEWAERLPYRPAEYIDFLLEHNPIGETSQQGIEGAVGRRATFSAVGLRAINLMQQISLPVV